MNKIKIIICVMYAVAIISMATATFIAQSMGNEYVMTHIYGSWWFMLILALLAASSVAWIVKSRMPGPSSLMMHGAWIVILAGALVTHITSQRNEISIVEGLSTTYNGVEICLDHFNIVYDPGTTAVADYVATITINEAQKSVTEKVSMNRILRHGDMRIYLKSYNPSNYRGTFIVYSDPWGIAITYTGYALLFLGFLIMLVSERRWSSSKHSLRALAWMLATCAAVCAILTIAITVALPLSKKQTLVEFNGRICPRQTLAISFNKQIYGSASFEGMKPEEVLDGWMNNRREWNAKPFIKVKGNALRKEFGLPAYASVNDFFDSSRGGYIIGPLVEEYHQGNNDNLHKQANAIDEKLMLIMQLQHGMVYREFTPDNPQYEEAVPADYRIVAEIIYNTLPLTPAVAFGSLTIGFLLMIASMLSISRQAWVGTACRTAHIVLWSLLTAQIALRWIILGSAPMTNGHEAMLLTAWFILSGGWFVFTNREKMLRLLPMVLIAGGFFMLVCYIGEKDPGITATMPVLRSPLLSIHVSMIMLSYALLVLATFRRSLLKPGLAALSVGIFVGAIWANVSWGEYWSWDPKETWALISLMVYAVPAHTKSIPAFQSKKVYRIYMACAFLTILMTYFGVNYWLGGMHSYA